MTTIAQHFAASRGEPEFWEDQAQEGDNGSLVDGVSPEGDPGFHEGDRTPPDHRPLALFKFNPNHAEGGHGSPAHGGSSGEFTSSDGGSGSGGGGGPSASEPNPTPGAHEPVLLAPHEQHPDLSRGKSGRGTPRPSNPDATRFSRMSPEVQKQLADALEEGSPNHLTGAKIEDNLEHLFADAKANAPDTINEGKRWYSDGQKAVYSYADKYGIDHASAVGLTAAMSPQNEWGQNIAGAGFLMKVHSENPSLVLTDAEKVYLQGKTKSARSGVGATGLLAASGSKFNDLPPEQAAWGLMLLGKRAGLHSSIPTPKGTYPKVSWSQGTGAIAKAIEISRGGSPDDVLNGHKVRSFYNNLSDPLNRQGHDDVTIDTHAVSAATGIRMAATSKFLGKMFSDGPTIRAQNTKGTYSIFADAFRNVASRHSMTPNQMQAVLWLHWQKVRYGYPDENGSGPRSATRGRYGTQPGSGKR